MYIPFRIAPNCPMRDLAVGPRQMSYSLRYIPVDPRFQPTHNAALSALSCCARFSLKQKPLIAYFLTVSGSLMPEVIGRAFIVPAVEQTLIPGGPTRCPRPGKQALPHCRSGRVAVKPLSL